MGLVDYSDSESDSEPQTAPTIAPRHTASNLATQPSSQAKKPFHKLLDPSNPGKIVISLPTAGPSNPSDEPPAKRARTADKSSFSSFNSFLPAPQKSKPAYTKLGASKPVGLKTSADVAFSRDSEGSGSSLGGGLSILPSKNGSTTNSGHGPTIPEGQKPAEEVKLVGKPLMFKPLSVARGPKKKKATPTKLAAATTASPAPGTGNAPEKTQTLEHAPARKVAVSLFSLDEAVAEANIAPALTSTGAYEPMIATDYSSVTGPYPSNPTHSDGQFQAQPPYQPTRAEQPECLATIADTMNLSTAERRELFGRDGPSASHSLANVVNLNMDREYAANEVLRASGETVQHNPLRSIAPGKHSLKQLVNAVQNQRDALEESFAKGKNNRKEAAGRYGWQ